jgi:hypothetical protein
VTAPVTAQAAALRAAAAFLEDAGLAGRCVIAGGDGSLVLAVPDQAGTPERRTAAVTAIAAMIGAPAPHRTALAGCAQVAASGTVAGHPARVTTWINDKEQHA